jgi:hypothetical protein
MSPDFLDLLRALSDAEARFMVVGAYAVGVHGHPRATKDLDVWVEASPDNAPKVINALRDFGAPLMGLTEEDLRAPLAIVPVEHAGVSICSSTSERSSNPPAAAATTATSRS